MTSSELKHTVVKLKGILNPDSVLDYLLKHPTFLENFVIGPHISRERFQRWTLKRNIKMQQDSCRDLLPNYMVILIN